MRGYAGGGSTIFDETVTLMKKQRCASRRFAQSGAQASPVTFYLRPDLARRGAAQGGARLQRATQREDCVHVLLDLRMELLQH